MKILLDQDQLQAIIKKAGLALNDPLITNWKSFQVVLCTLSGGVPFFSELIKYIDGDFEVDYIRARSYSSNTTQEVCRVSGPFCDTDLRGKDVLVVEDIIDTGKTIEAIHSYLLRLNCKSVTFISLLKRKSAKICIDAPVEYCVEVDDGWLVGFGLDDNQKKRNLPYIYVNI